LEALKCVPPHVNTLGMFVSVCSMLHRKGSSRTHTRWGMTEHYLERLGVLMKEPPKPEELEPAEPELPVKFQCDECDRVFTTSVGLKMHKEQWHPED